MSRERIILGPLAAAIEEMRKKADSLGTLLQANTPNKVGNRPDYVNS